MAESRYRVTVGERTYEVLVADAEGGFAVTLDPSGGGVARQVDWRVSPDGHLASAVVDGESVESLTNLTRDGVALVVRGVPFEVTVQDERAARLASLTAGAGRASGAATLKAPMPGLVVRVHAVVGASVQKGEPLVVLQAMKMENELAAPRGGTVKQVAVTSGQTVEHGQVLVVLE